MDKSRKTKTEIKSTYEFKRVQVKGYLATMQALNTATKKALNMFAADK